jgi:hypothetical protein
MAAMLGEARIFATAGEAIETARGVLMIEFIKGRDVFEIRGQRIGLGHSSSECEARFAQWRT